MEQMQDKLFTIEYRFLDDSIGIVRHYMTNAASRKCAEIKTREMVEPHRINIIKMYQNPTGRDFEHAFAMALMTFQENNVKENYASDCSY